MVQVVLDADKMLKDIESVIGKKQTKKERQAAERSWREAWPLAGYEPPKHKPKRKRTGGKRRKHGRK